MLVAHTFVAIALRVILRRRGRRDCGRHSGHLAKHTCRVVVQ